MAAADQRQLFAIDGLFCGGCARGLESRLQRLDGVAEAGVHFVTASALVRWDGARCDRDRIAACVREAGYRLIERHDLGATAAGLAAAPRMADSRSMEETRGRHKRVRTGRMWWVPLNHKKK